MVLTYTCAIFKTMKDHKTLHQFCGSMYVIMTTVKATHLRTGLSANSRQFQRVFKSIRLTAVFISIECPNPKFTLRRVSGSAEGKIIETYLFFENILKIK